MFQLEEAVLDWSRRLARAASLQREDAEELEGHLWDIIEGEMYAGVRPEEAFVHARTRMGEAPLLAADFAAVYEEEYMDFEKQITENREDPAALERLFHEKPQAFTASLERVLDRFPESRVLAAWKARLSYAPFLADRRKELGELLTVIGLCLCAAISVKIPLLWGVDAFKTDMGGQATFALNAGFFFMPMIAAYYLIRQKPRPLVILFVALFVTAACVLINLMPSQAPWQTQILSALHLPFLVWLVVGLAFTGNDWRSLPVRMDFVRSSGEIFIYTVLILLGGGVLTGFTLSLFNLIGMSIQQWYMAWIGLIGLCAAPIVATYLTEKKRGLADNFAPVLSYIFTPLFLVTLVVFLLIMVAQGRSPYTDRNFLLMFNAMLLLVIALVMYNISERKISAASRLFDALNAVLIVVALAIDAIALSAIIGRLSSYGISPNRLALLGENLLLLVNLAGLAVQYARFFARAVTFPKVENWTVRYLPVYGAWLVVVVFLFPVVFGYR